jgi:hypothetical protein
MDLTIESLNFCVGSLGLVCLSDPVNSGPSAGKTAFAAKSGTSIGSSSEVNSPVSIEPMKKKRSTFEELDKIMENLDLGGSSGSDENFVDNYHPGEDFMICWDNTLDKSTDTWKTGLKLYDDDQTFFSSSSSGVNHQYQVFAIVGDNSE